VKYGILLSVLVFMASGLWGQSHPNQVAEKHDFEKFTPQEARDYFAALNQLSLVESRIRIAHGENVRFRDKVPALAGNTKDCWGAEKIVKVLPDGVLVTTKFAGVGGNPPCF
jgi:hypothetical protein